MWSVLPGAARGCLTAVIGILGWQLISIILWLSGRINETKISKYVLFVLRLNQAIRITNVRIIKIENQIIDS